MTILPSTSAPLPDDDVPDQVHSGFFIDIETGWVEVLFRLDWDSAAPGESPGVDCWPYDDVSCWGVVLIAFLAGLPVWFWEM
jgi:hypothetical protein